MIPDYITSFFEEDDKLINRTDGSGSDVAIDIKVTEMLD